MNQDGYILWCLPRPVLPSPSRWRVGAHISSFEACSSFTRVWACCFARPPIAAFVTRLRLARLPLHSARQLTDSPTSICVEPSSTSQSHQVRRTPGISNRICSCVFSLVYKAFPGFAAIAERRSLRFAETGPPYFCGCAAHLHYQKKSGVAAHLFWDTFGKA